MADQQRARGGEPPERPQHPALAATLLMLGVVVLLLALAVSSMR